MSECGSVRCVRCVHPREGTQKMAVYFIENPERGTVKIGYSADPEKRLASLQTASCDKLVLLGSIPGGPSDERELHSRFGHLKKRNEWFQFTDELQGFVRSSLGPDGPRVGSPADGLRWVMVTGEAPDWARSAVIDADGVVYVPAAIGGNEDNVLICAVWENVTSIYSDGHLYLPSEWMAREYPDMADIVRLVESRVREFYPDLKDDL
jgi:hypothetical protein